MERWSVVVAAGSGTRFGCLKQLEVLADRRVVDWSVEAMSRVCDGVVVVGPEALGSAAELGVAARVDGGQTRTDSVRCGLAAVPPSADVILVHDSPRPLVPAAVVDAVVAALDDDASAVVPVVAVTDSLRSVNGQAVDRDRYVAVQTPQGFRSGILRRAHTRAVEENRVASDDASLVEALGVAVTQVDGDPINLKITYPHDLELARILLAGKTS